MESTLAVAAATWAIAMALGPLLQIRKMVRHQSSHTISIAYFLVLFVGFVLWVAYGIAADNYALIIPNTVATIVIAATIAVAVRYRAS
jgi:MtN3 and saliva related transmembrane protein